MKKDDNAFGVEEAADSPGFLLWQVTSLWQREIRKALEKYDLTHSQFVLLASTMWLMQQGEPVTQILLSAHSKIDPMTTSTVLRTLQTKGLLERKEHTTDTRAKTVALTTTGEKLARQAIKTVEQFDTDFFQALGSKLGDFNKKLRLLLQQ
ncbi:MarR family winged helix-turn-helix transcriptional regulator [Chitinophaga arvensicola]|uniref:DNA-binding transcriptional regulator, MarR family n=1 Tax=Chitinophaga arvensicola TaxID=29529 RepID=A0A1I0S6G4_9BACT|nr:MarR family transcriptional regulator [Chitinophaga arvensicola]SEW50998.1 DNA-binding transcriptional regulator, MarR family [Chitinophaga arvensicola]